MPPLFRPLLIYMGTGRHGCSDRYHFLGATDRSDIYSSQWLQQTHVTAATGVKLGATKCDHNVGRVQNPGYRACSRNDSRSR